MFYSHTATVGILNWWKSCYPSSHKATPIEHKEGRDAVLHPMPLQYSHPGAEPWKMFVGHSENYRSTFVFSSKKSLDILGTNTWIQEIITFEKTKVDVMFSICLIINTVRGCGACACRHAAHFKSHYDYLPKFLIWKDTFMNVYSAPFWKLAVFFPF